MEAQQGLPFKAQPMMLVGYRVDCTGIVDLTNPAVHQTLGIDLNILACPWEDLAERGLEVPTWRLAERLIAADVQAAIVPSFAPRGNPAGNLVPARNLVFWRWSASAPCMVVVIDDFGRLPKDAASWE
jgi:RES domain-containing protein